MTDEAMDEILLQALTRDVAAREALLEQARRDRRAVMLRMSEDGGATYARLSELGGMGETTVWKELKKARDESSNDLTLS